ISTSVARSRTSKTVIFINVFLNFAVSISGMRFALTAFRYRLIPLRGGTRTSQGAAKRGEKGAAGFRQHDRSVACADLRARRSMDRRRRAWFPRAAQRRDDRNRRQHRRLYVVL